MQTTYAARQPIGIHGGLYAAHESPDVVSYSSEILPIAPALVAVGAIAFASALTFGTNADDQVQAGIGSGGDFAGIALKSIDREYNDCEGVDGYRNFETIPVLRSGYFYCECPEGCVKGNPVDFTDDGVLHNGGGGTVIAAAQWEFTAAAGAIGVVRIMAPNPATI